jgi:LPPG:FO 2-phospho-L-lactate transferase
VKGFRFEGIEIAEAAPGALEAIAAAGAVVICPSNPWVSIDPILGVRGLRQAVQDKIILAVSPIIGGKTVKGPAAKMYAEMGIQPSALAVSNHYGGLLNGFVIDQADAGLEQSVGIPTLTTDTLMNTLTKRAHLARDVLHFLGRLNK